MKQGLRTIRICGVEFTSLCSYTKADLGLAMFELAFASFDIVKKSKTII